MEVKPREKTGKNGDDDDDNRVDGALFCGDDRYHRQSGSMR